MNANELDQLILADVGARWRKVAMVISVLGQDHGIFNAEGEEGLNRIAARIEALVADGQLVSQGDLKKWRHSEVRKP
jgi:hypothetical protein